jgi:hypothetical protein
MYGERGGGGICRHQKKDLIGNYGNKGREWRPSGEALEVEVHDVMDKELGKTIPYGVYDVKGNEGWVRVGIDHDRAECAAEALWRWWRKRGRGTLRRGGKNTHHGLWRGKHGEPEPFREGGVTMPG